MASESTLVRIYTDGACLRNPGPGGWGALIETDADSRVISGGDQETTNNRMELTAVIEALALVQSNSTIEIYSDSKYVIDGMTRYIHNWKVNHWRKADSQPVKNQRLWMQLDELVQQHNITWKWVRAHTGHPQNEFVDSIAREEATKRDTELNG